MTGVKPCERCAICGKPIREDDDVQYELGTGRPAHSACLEEPDCH